MRRAALAPSPLPRLRRKRLRFERCRRRRPPPAKLQRAEPAPAAALLTSHPNSSTDRRGLPLPTPLSPRRRRLLTRVPRSRGLGSGAARGPEDSGPLGAAAGAWPSRRGQGQGLAFASRRGRLAPPPPLPSGFPSRPPSVALSCAKISVLCGRRRTLLRARPPPDSSPGAARRPARRSRPAPAARSRPLGGPPSLPGNVRLVGRGPALPRFSFLPLARA